MMRTRHARTLFAYDQVCSQQVWTSRLGNPHRPDLAENSTGTLTSLAGFPVEFSLFTQRDPSLLADADRASRLPDEICRDPILFGRARLRRAAETVGGRLRFYFVTCPSGSTTFAGQFVEHLSETGINRGESAKIPS